MPGTTVTEELELTGVGGGGRDLGGSDDDGSGAGGAPGVSSRVYFTGVTIGLGAILMFFMALTSAYIVRKGLAVDWKPITLPRVLWFNTLVLLASSVTIEKARRQLRQAGLDSFRRWWALTTALGLLFLGGQLLAWRQLAAAGVYMASNPSSSFFYLLTAAHGLHLLGGIVGLLYIALRSWQRFRLTRDAAAEVASIYWHFMDGLWVFLLLLLQLGR